MTWQRFAVLLAPAELTYCFRFGSLTYPQRHGFCSLSLLQQAADGGCDDMIALRHGASSVGEHVTAFATCSSPAITIITATTTAVSVALPPFILIYTMDRQTFRNGIWNVMGAYETIYSQIVTEIILIDPYI